MDIFGLISLDLLDRFSQSLHRMKGHYVQMMDLQPFFQFIKERCHGNQIILQKPPAFGALELENELQYRGLSMRNNSAYDACISCESFVKFGSVTQELTGLICERQV